MRKFKPRLKLGLGRKALAGLIRDAVNAPAWKATKKQRNVYNLKFKEVVLYDNELTPKTARTTY